MKLYSKNGRYYDCSKCVFSTPHLNRIERHVDKHIKPERVPEPTTNGLSKEQALALRQAGISDLEQVDDKTLLAIPGIGKATLKRLRAQLGEHDG